MEPGYGLRRGESLESHHVRAIEGPGLSRGAGDVRISGFPLGQVQARTDSSPHVTPWPPRASDFPWEDLHTALLFSATRGLQRHSRHILMWLWSLSLAEHCTQPLPQQDLSFVEFWVHGRFDKQHPASDKTTEVSNILSTASAFLE